MLGHSVLERRVMEHGVLERRVLEHRVMEWCGWSVGALYGGA